MFHKRNLKDKEFPKTCQAEMKMDIGTNEKVISFF